MNTEHVEETGFRGLDHLQKGWLVSCGGTGFVAENLNDVLAAACGVLRAGPDLGDDAFFTMIVGAVGGVDGGSCHKFVSVGVASY